MSLRLVEDTVSRARESPDSAKPSPVLIRPRFGPSLRRRNGFPPLLNEGGLAYSTRNEPI